MPAVVTGLDSLGRSGPPLAGAALSFATVVYLALSDGGYDTVSRDQVGVLGWFAVLLGAVVGIVPQRLGRCGYLAVASILAFAAWTAASIGWSLSPGRSVDSVGMVATYAGVFVLALTVQGRAAARPAVGGAAAAVGLIGWLSVLSRLHPAWFPPDPNAAYLGSSSRLSYPLGYWNGLAAFLAIGVPLLLAVASGKRAVAARALATATIPVLALGIFLSSSRGGVIALAVALAAFLLLTADRLAAILAAFVAALGSTILITYAERHRIIGQGLRDAAARQAGDRMIVVVVLTGTAVALVGVVVARRIERLAWLRPSRRQAQIGWAVVLVVLVGALALGLAGQLASDWRDFKLPVGVGRAPSGGADLFSRLSSASGNNRYQYWTQAIKAYETRPLAGIGAGAFGLWWSVHATVLGHVTDAHSLYVQTLGETGIVGLALMIGLLVGLLVGGVRRTLAAEPALRRQLAGATSGVAAFVTSAAYDWVWQLGAVAALALILGAVSLVGHEPATTSPAAEAVGAEVVHTERRRSAGPLRMALGLVALAALIAAAVPLAVARDLTRSQSAAAHGDLSVALADAWAANRIEPYAAAPSLQAALIFEQAGDLPDARNAVLAATRREPTNWQPWLILARIESELGHRAQALGAFAHARRLDPLGPVFNS